MARVPVRDTVAGRCRHCGMQEAYRVSEIAEQNICHKILLSSQTFDKLVPQMYYPQSKVEEECTQGRGSSFQHLARQPIDLKKEALTTLDLNDQERSKLPLSPTTICKLIPKEGGLSATPLPSGEWVLEERQANCQSEEGEKSHLGGRGTRPNPWCKVITGVGQPPDDGRSDWYSHSTVLLGSQVREPRQLWPKLLVDPVTTALMSLLYLFRASVLVLACPFQKNDTNGSKACERLKIGWKVMKTCANVLLQKLCPVPSQDPQQVQQNAEVSSNRSAYGKAKIDLNATTNLGTKQKCGKLAQRKLAFPENVTANCSRTKQNMLRPTSQLGKEECTQVNDRIHTCFYQSCALDERRSSTTISPVVILVIFLTVLSILCALCSVWQVTHSRKNVTMMCHSRECNTLVLWETRCSNSVITEETAVILKCDIFLSTIVKLADGYLRVKTMLVVKGVTTTDLHSRMQTFRNAQAN
ncbi:MAG: hypothetical protein GY820_34710, partial [Gammaproteobacteria bacterium]|nr:hypothetical protein [Gammaproteobacteria bacterium]